MVSQTFAFLHIDNNVGDCLKLINWAFKTTEAGCEAHAGRSFTNVNHCNDNINIEIFAHGILHVCMQFALCIAIKQLKRANEYIFCFVLLHTVTD